MARKKKKPVNMEKRVLPQTTVGQEYCKCTKVHGGKIFELQFLDRTKRLGKLRGSMRKNSRNWISVETWVIASIRDFQTSKCDIIEILQADEVESLKKLGEIRNIGEVSVQEDSVEFDINAEIPSSSDDDDDDTVDDGLFSNISTPSRPTKPVAPNAPKKSSSNDCAFSIDEI